MWRTEINSDKSAQKSLARYCDVVRNRKIAIYYRKTSQNLIQEY